MASSLSSFSTFLPIFSRSCALYTGPVSTSSTPLVSGRSVPLSSFQSPETAASSLVNYIEKHIYTKSHCLAAFLDIRSAFDSITPQHIQRSLLDLGANPQVVGWYHGYLQHRNMTYHHGHTSTSRTMGMGFPQGGVCSATFWSLAFDEAVRLTNNAII